jgi:Beta-propeller repeat
MVYPRHAVRWAITLALVVIGLFHTPAGSGNARRWLESPSLPHSALALNSAADEQTRARVNEAYGKLPLRFEADGGQSAPRFRSSGGGYNLFLTSTEAVLALRKKRKTSGANAQSIVRMKLVGASSAPRMEGVKPLPGRSHYLIGNDPSRWRRNVMSYARVRYENVYPGIDLVYYGNQQKLEYDFVVAAGVDPNSIKLTFDGVKRMEVDDSGDLILQTGDGEVRQRKPVAYQESGQEADGRRWEIASRYVLTGEQQVGFELAAYDRTRPLVIDPVLDYSTYLGGMGVEQAHDVAVDAEGNAYVTGSTTSLDFPTAGPLQPAYSGGGNLNVYGDVFVTKLNREGSAAIYSTYLGGSDIDHGSGIAVDEYGHACVTGFTLSNDFPTRNPLQPAYGGGGDIFIAKLKADGSSLIYSTYLGGSGVDSGQYLAIDGAGNAYLTGYTGSTDFQTKDPLQPNLAGGGADIFIAKLKADGSSFIYSTYLGGSGPEDLSEIAVAEDGSVYLTGRTSSPDFPTANPLQPALGSEGVSDAFVAKLDRYGATLVYSTYLGGDDEDWGAAIAVDAEGRAYVTGVTRSADFPTVSPLQPALSGSSDIFVARFDRSGAALHYSTYLGGTGEDESADIAVDRQGCIYLTGTTQSLDFPTLRALQSMPEPPPNDQSTLRSAFITKLDAPALIYSSYLGGGDNALGTGIALDTRGDAYVVGSTVSEDFPTTVGAYQPARSPGERGPFLFYGVNEAFIAKISDRRRR